MEPQQSLFSWAEFMAEEPVKPKPSPPLTLGVVQPLRSSGLQSHATPQEPRGSGNVPQGVLCTNGVREDRGLRQAGALEASVQ